MAAASSISHIPRLHETSPFLFDFEVLKKGTNSFAWGLVLPWKPYHIHFSHIVRNFLSATVIHNSKNEIATPTNKEMTITIHQTVPACNRFGLGRPILTSLVFGLVRCVLHQEENGANPAELPFGSRTSERPCSFWLSFWSWKTFLLRSVMYHVLRTISKTGKADKVSDWKTQKTINVAF